MAASPISWIKLILCYHYANINPLISMPAFIIACTKNKPESLKGHIDHFKNSKLSFVYLEHFS